MKKASLVILAAIMLLCCVSLSGCGYRSKYSAVAFVHSNKPDASYMSFLSFDGVMVFNMKCGKGSEGRIKYTGKLESGSINVYYDTNGKKTQLFSLSSGDEISSAGGELDRGKVYIIVETNGKCEEGSLSFEIE